MLQPFPTFRTLTSTLLTLLALGGVVAACDPGDELSLDEEALLDEAEADEADEADEAQADEASSEVQQLALPEGSDEVPAPVDERRPSAFTAEIDPISYHWENWFSDEDPGRSCDSGHLMTGADCSGSHCDSVRLECHPTSRTLTDRNPTVWFSDEGSGWQVCPGDSFVSGMRCRGNYCDDIALECTNTGYTPPAHTCTWSGWFSEEDAVFLAPVGHAVKGAQCSGSNCDNKRYYYCAI